MKKLLIAVVLLTVGCLGTTKQISMKSADYGIWWRTPYASDTPRDKNPWLKFVPVYQPPNEFDPWANDDLQRYSVSPIVSKTQMKPKESSKSKPKDFF